MLIEVRADRTEGARAPGAHPGAEASWATTPATAAGRGGYSRDDKSHKLWTDDYLAAFAQVSDATLATLDGKFPSHYPSVRVEWLLR